MYDDLDRLHDLLKKGVISEEEFQKEKTRILNNIESENTQQSQQTSYPIAKQKLWGLDENGFCTIMHFSQFLGMCVPVLGYALPVFMWIVGKDDSAMVDKQGRAIINWLISFVIWMAISGVLSFLVIGIPIIIGLAIANIVFVIKAAMYAKDGKFWPYPLSIKIL